MFADLDNAVFFNDDIVFVNTNSDNATFCSDGISLVNVDLINVDKALMMIIFTMMILKLLFTLNLGFDVIDISNALHVRKR